MFVIIVLLLEYDALAFSQTMSPVKDREELFICPQALTTTVSMADRHHIFHRALVNCVEASRVLTQSLQCFFFLFLSLTLTVYIMLCGIQKGVELFDCVQNVSSAFSRSRVKAY